MVASMTAFARKTLDTPFGTAVWEMRSVNHRFLDIGTRLPEEFRALEPEVRERIGARLKRGKVDCTLRFDANGAASEHIEVNLSLARRIAEACDEISTALPNSRSIDPLEILRWPGVMAAQSADLEALGQTLLELLDETLASLVEARLREGGKLARFVKQRVADARTQSAKLRERVPEIIAAIKDRFAQRIGESKEDFEPGRLEQELVILAQKLDVDEEFDRLETHLDELERNLAKTEPIGRRLDFLVQELNREANTLASKSAHVETSAGAVELKVLIEQMREQIQNIE
jgi:uncharacterized protein (TIGR00255 family)